MSFLPFLLLTGHVIYGKQKETRLIYELFSISTVNTRQDNTTNNMEKVTCFVTHQQIEIKNAIIGSEIRRNIFNFIKVRYPGFSDNDYISLSTFNKIRVDYLAYLIDSENKNISEIQHQVIESITNNQILSEDIEPIIDRQLTVGQRAADKIAEFGGSWKFIIFFFVILFCDSYWLDRFKSIFVRQATIRSLPFHTIKSDSLLYCCNSGTNHYDEPESGRAKRPFTRRERL